MLSQPNWSEFANYQQYQEKVHIVEQIGNGTNGTVYKAYTTINEGTQQEKDIYFAVKRIELKEKNIKQKVYQCEQQNKFLAQIDHPNIMKVYFSFAHITPVDKYYFVGMELGLSDLSTIIEHKKISYESDIFGIAQQIWRALNFLEENNTAHRDLKPANVLLGQDGVYKLCDFSEVKFDEENFKTETNTVAGTLVYLAPELFQAYFNGKSFTHCHPIKTDTFSFGVLLLQTILRCKSIALQGINSNQQITKQLLNSNFSKFFREFIGKCLEFDPTKRWTFKDMKSIFAMNSFEMNQHLIEINEQNKVLQEKLNLQETAQKKIANYEKKIVGLEKQNQDLLLKLQLQEKQLLQMHDNPQPPSQNMRKKKNLSDEQLKEIWEHKYKSFFENYPSFEEREIQVKKNCGLNLSQESGIWPNYNYYYWVRDFRDSYFIRGDCWKYDKDKNFGFVFFYYEDEKRYNAFTADDTPKALEMLKNLSIESGIGQETCLKSLFFNFWNYNDALNELTE